MNLLADYIAEQLRKTFPNISISKSLLQIAITKAMEDYVPKGLPNQYYEVISTFGSRMQVIGCVSEEVVFDYAKEDENYIFGEISDENMQRYGDNPWLSPISTKRFKVVFGSKMIRIKE